MGASSKYLNKSASDGQKNGAKVQIWNNPEDTDSQWRLARCDAPDTYTLQSVSGGKWLNKSGSGGTSNGTKVQCWDNRDSPDSQWLLEEVAALGDGIYTLKNVAAEKWLNKSGRGGNENGAKVQIWDNPLSDDTKWDL